LIGTNTRPAGPDLEIRKKNMEQSRLKFKCKEWIVKPNQVGWELGGPSKFGAIFQPRQGAEAQGGFCLGNRHGDAGLKTAWIFSGYRVTPTKSGAIWWPTIADTRNPYRVFGRSSR
jgi:hypothetical protein